MVLKNDSSIVIIKKSWCHTETKQQSVNRNTIPISFCNCFRYLKIHQPFSTSTISSCSMFEHVFGYNPFVPGAWCAPFQISIFFNCLYKHHWLTPFTDTPVVLICLLFRDIPIGLDVYSWYAQEFFRGLLFCTGVWLPLCFSLSPTFFCFLRQSHGFVDVLTRRTLEIIMTIPSK